MNAAAMKIVARVMEKLGEATAPMTDHNVEFGTMTFVVDGAQEVQIIHTDGDWELDMLGMVESNRA